MIHHDAKILQIIPALPGWVAAYRDEGDLITEPLVCWALVEEPDGERSVVGQVGSDYVDHAETASNFFGYFATEAKAQSAFESDQQPTAALAEQVHNRRQATLAVSGVPKNQALGAWPFGEATITKVWRPHGEQA